MKILIILALLYMANKAVVIKPDTVNQIPYISVNLTADPRGFNGVEDNEWNLVQRISNTLNDWALILTLEAEEYAFNWDSSVSISICGRSESPSPNNQNDPFFAISFGDEEYFTFATDLDDSGLKVTSTSKDGTFIYPECGSNSIIQGSPIGLIPDDGSGTFDVWEFRDLFADGDAENFDKLTSTINGENFPLKFEFINDQDEDTLTIKYSTPTFTTPLECTYNTAIPDGKDLKLYLTPDVQDENLVIESFTINEDTTCADTVEPTNNPTEVPTIDGCDFDIETYLEQCYCIDGDVNGQVVSAMVDGKYNYDNNKYYGRGDNFNPNGNNDFIIYLILVLNIIMFGYILCLHSRMYFIKGNNKTVYRYEKGNVDSDQI